MSEYPKLQHAGFNRQNSGFAQTMNHPMTTLIALGLAAGSFVSCSSVKTAMSTAAKPVQNLSKLNSNDWKMFKLRDLRNDTPPIVQVRPGDLKKLKTGEDHILAWKRSQRSSTYSVGSPNGAFFMPEDFDPSSLPDGGFTGTYGILPSLNLDGSPGAEAGEELGTPSGELPSVD